jgi:hypothetical protein
MANDQFWERNPLQVQKILDLLHTINYNTFLSLPTVVGELNHKSVHKHQQWP